MRFESIATNSKINSLIQTGSWSRRLILAGCGVILVFAPLAYGAVHPWAYCTMALAVTALSLICLAGGFYHLLFRSGTVLELPYPPVWWASAGFVLLVCLQVAPWPHGLVAQLSPASWEIRSLGHGYGLANYLPLSLNPYATWLAGLKWWPAVVYFYLLIYLVDTRQKIEWIVRLILAVALFEVIYGLRHLSNPSIWGWSNPYTGRLCGTFINSNHLAIFLTMAILLGFGLFLSQSESAARLPRGLSRWARVRSWSQAEYLEPLFRHYFLLVLLLVLTVGEFFTGSRGGIICLVLGVGFMVLLGRRRGGRYIWTIVALLAGALLYGLHLDSGWVLARFSDLDQQSRYQAYKGALAIFWHFPLVGSGIGTFGEVFYRYEPAKLGGLYFDYTHNDWLQMLAEGGLAGFCLMGATWLIFFSGLLRIWSRRQNGFSRGLGLGGLAALCAGTMNALVEFPFHIPAVSLIFAAIAAITYLATYYHRHIPGHYPYRLVRLGSPSRVGTWLLLGLIGLQVAFAITVCYHEQAERVAPMETNSTRKPQKIGVNDFRHAVAFSNSNGKYLMGLAEALEQTQSVNEEGLAEIENLLQEAIFQSPANWGYHLKLAEFSLRHYGRNSAKYIPLALQEMAAAVTLFPQSDTLQSRFTSVQGWVEKYYSGLVPLGLRQRDNCSEALP